MKPCKMILHLLLLIGWALPAFSADQCSSLFAAKPASTVLQQIASQPTHPIFKRNKVQMYLERLLLSSSIDSGEARGTFEINPYRGERGLAVSGAFYEEGSALKIMVWRTQIVKAKENRFGSDEVLAYGEKPSGLDLNMAELYGALILMAKDYQKLHSSISSVAFVASDVQSPSLQKLLLQLGFVSLMAEHGRNDFSLTIALPPT